MSGVKVIIMKSFETPRPPEKVWEKAILYDCYLFDSRWPVCGYRLLWVIVGRKWVKLCTPVTNKKWRMRRTDWDKTKHKVFIKQENDDD